MKIAIIGTNGFLSTAIAKYALEKGWQVNMYGLEEPRLHTFTHFYSIDLTKESINASQVCNNDIILYAVGAGIQSNLNESINLVYELNVMVPIRICKVLQDNNFNGKFVSFGSYFELGEINFTHPATELDVVNAISPAPTDYILSKRMLTRFISSYKHNYVHWHFILPTIFGVGENPKRIIPYTINAIKNNESLCFTSGEQVRQYLCVEEVAQCIYDAYVNNLPSGIYNIASTIILSVQQLVRIICDKMNYAIDSNVFGLEKKTDTSMNYLVLDGTKLNQLIGFNSIKLLNDVLEKYMM